ncbi:hypothetical protein GGR50DRAFT_695185 [Xylaria sp. CBS 124048]|nr:hypothetical protein GGR50DRAFT_695185 [Xylaria sp. CBS 124048]
MAADNVEIKDSGMQGAGRGLFARRAFAPGEVILELDRPYLFELSPSRLSNTCSWYHQRAGTDPSECRNVTHNHVSRRLIKISMCNKCRKVGYCSKTCQALSWENDHKFECKLFKRESLWGEVSAIRAVMKTLRRLVLEYPGEAANVRRLLELRPVVDRNVMEEYIRIDPERFEHCIDVAGRALGYAGKPTDIDGLDARTLAEKLAVTFFGAGASFNSAADGGVVGFGVDPLFSLINHSCDPNAIMYSQHADVELRALGAINAGDEICLEYVDGLRSFAIRQFKMQKLFSCQCAKCKTGEDLEVAPLVEQAKKLEGEYRRLADGMVCTHESNLSPYLLPGYDKEAQKRAVAWLLEAYRILDAYAGVDEVKRFIRLSIDSELFSWTRQPVPRLCAKLQKLYMENGQISKALRIAIKLHIDVYPTIHDKFHPITLENAWNILLLINELKKIDYGGLHDVLASRQMDLTIIRFGFLFYLHDYMTGASYTVHHLYRTIMETYKEMMDATDMPKKKIRRLVRSNWDAIVISAREMSTSNL